MTKINDKIRVVYMGSPACSIPCWEAILTDSRYEVLGLWTQPDRTGGRDGNLIEPPAKIWAESNGLNVHQAENINMKESIDKLTKMEVDIVVVVAFGQILSREILSVPRYGVVNVHPSLLPMWRGATPIQSALLAGDSSSGVSIQRMAYKMDTGDIIASKFVDISPEDNAEDLFEKLFVMAGNMLPDVLFGYISGKIIPVEQDNAKATYCKKIVKADGRIIWGEYTAEYVVRMCRAYSIWPNVYTIWGDKMIKLSKIVVARESGRAGEVAILGNKLVIYCTEGSVEVGQVQIAGKKPIPALDFVRGYGSIVGAVLE